MIERQTEHSITNPTATEANGDLQQQLRRAATKELQPSDYSFSLTIAWVTEPGKNPKQNTKTKTLKRKLYQMQIYTDKHTLAGMQRASWKRKPQLGECKGQKRKAFLHYAAQSTLLMLGMFLSWVQ